MGPKQTPNDKIKKVLMNTGPLYGSPWKNFSFAVTCSGAPPWDYVYSIVEILFPHTYWPMLGMPSCYWLSHTYVTACHTAKTRRISLIFSIFSWIYNQTGFPGSYSMCRMQRLTIPGGLMFTLNIFFQIFFQMSANGFRNLCEKTAGNDVLWLSGEKSPS